AAPVVGEARVGARDVGDGGGAVGQIVAVGRRLSRRVEVRRQPPVGGELRAEHGVALGVDDLPQQVTGVVEVARARAGEADAGDQIAGGAVLVAARGAVGKLDLGEAA